MKKVKFHDFTVGLTNEEKTNLWHSIVYIITMWAVNYDSLPGFSSLKAMSSYMKTTMFSSSAHLSSGVDRHDRHRPENHNKLNVKNTNKADDKCSSPREWRYEGEEPSQYTVITITDMQCFTCLKLSSKQQINADWLLQKYVIRLIVLSY